MFVNPVKLQTHNRLDVFTKTALAESWLRGVDESWGRHIYAQYMLAIEPDDGFNEDGKKFSLSDYFHDYNNLFHSIKHQGFLSQFGSIPFRSEGITNGSHRLAVSLVLNLPVSTEPSLEQPHIYDYLFFRKQGIPTYLIEAAVSEYLKYSQKTVMYCAFGITKKQNEDILQSLRNFGVPIVYHNMHSLSEIGQRRIIKIMYGSNTWWDDNLYETLHRDRFNNTNTVSIIYADIEDWSMNVGLKEKLRTLHFKENHFKKLHSTDTSFETLFLSETLLNQNSWHFINNAPLGSENKVLENVKILTDKHELDLGHILFDGSALMELYGFRRAQDLDYITLEQQVSKNFYTTSHNTEYRHFPISCQRLILDPRCHFTISGAKFLTIPELIYFKLSRGEEKDINDVRMMLLLKSDYKLYQDFRQNQKARRVRLGLKVRRNVESALEPFPFSFQKNFKALYKSIRNAIKKLIPVWWRNS